MPEDPVTSVPGSEDASDKTASGETDQKAARAQEFKSFRRRFAFKVGFFWAGGLALGVGAIFTLLFLIDFNAVVERLALEGLAGQLREWGAGLFESALQALPDTIERDLVGLVEKYLGQRKVAQPADYMLNLGLFVVAAVLNVVVFLVALVGALVGGYMAGRNAARHGEGATSGLAALAWTRNSRWAGLALILAGVSLATAGLIEFGLIVRNVRAFVTILPFFLGAGLGLVGMGLATLIRLGYWMEPPEELPTVTPPDRPEVPQARATGRELLELLRNSPIYRRQVACERLLPGFAFSEDTHDVLARLVARYPRIASVIPATGIRLLTNDQAKALGAILHDDAQGKSHGIDYVFMGWPGSGRSTVANLLALAGVLHREGAMYCLAGENPSLATGTTSRTQADLDGHGAPVTQLRRWIDACGLGEQVRVQEAYDDGVVQGALDLRTRPDVVMTDVKTLSEAVLSQVRGDARGLIAKLRYVIIDQPNRLSREELIRLRLAIARLRMSAEMMGRSPSFILIIPPLDNAQEFVKFLLNNDNAPPHSFMGWPGSCDLVGWVPPLELLSYEENEDPLLVRANFSQEVLALLTEIGYLSNQLQKDLKVAVVDPKPLLGPEAREQIRILVQQQVGEEVPEDQSIRVRLDWTYLGTQEVALEHPGQFDAIVCLGIGGHPAYLVSSLRPALAHEGAMILVADSSPADLASLKTIADPAWDPFRAMAELRIPALVLPNHSEAVIAHELAALFEDFQDNPLPSRRIAGIFPGEHTQELLREWLRQRRIEYLDVFETTRQSLRPQIDPCIRRADPTFGADQYYIPWGCCSRRVLELFDSASRTFPGAQERDRAYVDFDRLFIDYYPEAVRRHPPYTVRISDCQTYSLRPEDRDAARRRMVVHGRVEQTHTLITVAIQIDRRRPMIDQELLAEWPKDPGRPLELSRELEGRLAAHPLKPVFRVPSERLAALYAGVGGRRPSDLDRDVRLKLVNDLKSPTLTIGRNAASVYVAGGLWACKVRETLRDVMATDGRLVEEPVLTQSLGLSNRLRMSREFDCLAVSMFLATRPLATNRQGATGTGESGRAAGGEPEAGSTVAQRVLDRPSVQAFARAMHLQVGSAYLNFESEIRMAVLPNAPEVQDGAVNGATAATEGSIDKGYRILFYGLHGDELGERHSLEWLLDGVKLQALLRQVRDRLESCDCDDGCAQCCGGLGTIPKDRLPWSGYTKDDAISRKGGYELVNGLLGLRPDWNAYTEGQRRRKRGDVGLPPGVGPEPDGVPPTDPEMEALVQEIIGTDAGGYADGVWTRLFGTHMVHRRESVARAGWSTRLRPGVAGIYMPSRNEVAVRPNMDRDAVRETLVHEFAHNWQFKSEVFDLERLHESPEARRYFRGKLVIEGHATWADNQFRFMQGRGPEYAIKDGRNWNEYKVGYFLFERIEKAVGQRGLFLWLMKDARGGTGGGIRSRDARLRWPFTLTEALRAFGLEEAARTGRFTDFDVSIDGDDSIGPSPSDGNQA